MRSAGPTDLRDPLPDLERRGRTVVRALALGSEQGQRRLSCDQVRGKAKVVTVPEGVGLENVEYCFPSVLVDHWDEVGPMLGPFNNN
jgi:hypothetical protein